MVRYTFEVDEVVTVLEAVDVKDGEVGITRLRTARGWSSAAAQYMWRSRALDAPTREMCITRRQRTNTPLMALVLMNAPPFVEAARALAVRALVRDVANQEARLQWLFARVPARRPRVVREGRVEQAPLGVRMYRSRLGVLLGLRPGLVLQRAEARLRLVGHHNTA